MSGRRAEKHLLGEDYKNDELTSFKPHTISAASFKKPLVSKVTLTSHMLKVAKLLPESEETLILPSGGVNVDDNTDKSLSAIVVQPVTQSKSPTDKRESSPLKQVADTTKSVDASESAEVLGNWPKLPDAEK
ncbi:hypothetical protein Tco_0275242, partial [Tanacetum coccineum]